jgi:UPF0716 family protein affecting phage T7 exclusion
MPMHPLQVVRERLEPPFIAPSSRRMLVVGLVIVGAVVVIVPLIMSFTLGMISLLAPALYLVACISIANDVVQFSIIPALVTFH